MGRDVEAQPPRRRPPRCLCVGCAEAWRCDAPCVVPRRMASRRCTPPSTTAAWSARSCCWSAARTRRPKPSCVPCGALVAACRGLRLHAQLRALRRSHALCCTRLVMLRCPMPDGRRSERDGSGACFDLRLGRMPRNPRWGCGIALIDCAEARCSLCGRAQNGRTPLYFAAQGGRLECVQLLLERGADKEAKDKVRLPLICARMLALCSALRCGDALLRRTARRRLTSQAKTLCASCCACPPSWPHGWHSCSCCRMARGCHKLIRDGARLVESIDDILEELGPLFETTTTAALPRLPA